MGHFTVRFRGHSAWQGTDLMHNHVLADSSANANLPGNTTDQSEDSDYDSVWTMHSYRTGSFSRKKLDAEAKKFLYI